ncbi:hypothetical protein LTR50_006244 [Elasticomyces elasticus]|nr:hypothetical protein LTR50_006244 [Elasticomyces elasticus]
MSSNLLKLCALVFEDADLEEAVPNLVSSMRLFSGQMCMAPSRVYVHEETASDFIKQYRPWSARRSNSVREGKNQGGNLVLGGGDEEQSNGHHKGYYIAPTISIDTPEDARIVKEEIFGSVVSLNTFTDEDDVLAKANDTEYGLYASVYTRVTGRALRFAKRPGAGAVGVHCTSPANAMDLPFGRYRASGKGRERMLDSMEHYLETKTVLIKTGCGSRLILLRSKQSNE